MKILVLLKNEDICQHGGPTPLAGAEGTRPPSADGARVCPDRPFRFLVLRRFTSLMYVPCVPPVDV